MGLSCVALGKLLYLPEPWVLPLESKVRSLAVVREGTLRPSACAWREQAVVSRVP